MGKKHFRTQGELAKAVGISSTYYCDIIHERRTPRYSIAEKLEEVTGVEARAWLMPEKYFNAYIATKCGGEYSYIIRRNLENRGKSCRK